MLAEVSDKVIGVGGFYLLGAVLVALAFSARRSGGLRLCAGIVCTAWLMLNVQDVVADDAIRQAVVAELGRGYFGHQLVAASMPLVVIVIPPWRQRRRRDSDG